MTKYEVWVTVWSDEYQKQIKICAGQFDRFMNASLFQKAYNDCYKANAEIVEYVRK